MRVESGELPSLKEPIHPTGERVGVYVYKNIPIEGRMPLGVRLMTATLPVVRGDVQRAGDFRRQCSLYIGSLPNLDICLPENIASPHLTGAYRKDFKEKFGRTIDPDLDVSDSPLYAQWIEARFGITPYHGTCIANEAEQGVRVYYGHREGGQSFLNGVPVGKYNVVNPRSDRISVGKMLVKGREPHESVFMYDLFFTAPKD